MNVLRTSLYGLLALTALVLITIGVVWNNLPALPAIESHLQSNQRGNIYILAANGELIEQRGSSNRRRIAPADMPVHLPAAVLAIEDEHFYRHVGFDPFAIVRALIANRQAGRIVQGASTITQQVAKLLYLQPERTWQRKYRELALALSLEQRYSKDEILGLYLNNVYLGSGNYGVEAASRDYFGKSARDLNLSESAMLAGLLQAPSRYAPTRDLNKARARAGVVLDRMLAIGAITPEQAALAQEHPAQ
ncbi:MAG: penicillin-binding protein, partial [Gammaproteobacteria bacterium]|nr:penicillin-binding protein [Gammaproteobacteria bacterium]